MSLPGSYVSEGPIKENQNFLIPMSFETILTKIAHIFNVSKRIKEIVPKYYICKVSRNIMNKSNNEKPSVASLKEALLNSHWPKCNEYAKSLARIGSNEAKEALITALKGKRHHIRTAAIESLAEISDTTIISLIEPFLGDSSYETRMAAKHALEKLTGNEVKTKRGE